MNAWDYFKFFPAFDHFFGDKALYLTQDEQEFFSKLTPEEVARVGFYREGIKHFRPFEFAGISRTVFLLSVEVLVKVAFFPYNFTFFDYSADSKLNEVSLTCFPEGLIPLLLDFECFALLQQFFLGCKLTSPARSALQLRRC